MYRHGLYAIGARLKEPATDVSTAPLGVFATLKSSRAALPAAEHGAAARLMPDLVPIMKSEDVQEGLQAFVQRRPGAFKGR